MDALRSLVVTRLQRLGKLYHTCHGILFEEVLVIKMVKEYIESLLRVDDLFLEVSRCSRLNALHVRAEKFKNRPRVCWDMAPVTKRYQVVSKC